MSLTRRQVLAAAGAVGVAGSLGLGTAAWRWWERPPAEGLRALTAEEHAFVQALAEAWMPRGGHPALSGADAALGDFLDDVIAAMPPPVGRQLRLLLVALDHASVPTHASRFRALALADRQAVLAAWLHSDIALFRSGVHAVVALLSLGWTNHPDVAAELRPMFRCGFGR